MFNHLAGRVGMALCVSMLGLTAAHADIVLSGTRVIFKQDDRDITLKMDNRGARPVLTQMWIDDGNDDTQPQNMKVPFMVSPPISRVDAGRGQTIRVSWLEQGRSLPKDRETLFWFNVLEIPAKVQENNANILQLAFRTRIKLFYRPQGLVGSPVEAAKALKWQLKTQGAQVIAHVVNDSAYYISLSKAEFHSGNIRHAIDTRMVSPKSSADFTVKDLQTVSAGEILYSSINDLGGSVENSFHL
ncbi:fimbrial chaperone [Salmonella enterica]|nr:fimbrial chaperone [Salmonella enterica]EFQ6618143.1 fimbrial chaperone [Salmonella enterica]